MIKVFGDGTLDYENPVDANKDNLYELEIYIGDADLNDTYFTTIKVLDLDETPPYFITGQGQSPYQIEVKENQKFVVQAIATDPETSDLTYSIVSGGEEEFFKIDARYGVLEFLQGQNFEYPADANEDGHYEVTIQVSDGTHNVTQTIVARLTDVNDAPYVWGQKMKFRILSPLITLYWRIKVLPLFSILSMKMGYIHLEYLSEPSSGTLQKGVNSFTYSPNPNFYGTDSFQVKVADDQSTRVQTLYLQVIDQDDPPVAEQDDILYINSTDKSPFRIEVLDLKSSTSQSTTVSVATVPSKGFLFKDMINEGSEVFIICPVMVFQVQINFRLRLPTVLVRAQKK